MKEKSEILIHIGYMKCASTFIQTTIFQRLHDEGKINYIRPYQSKARLKLFQYLTQVDPFNFNLSYVKEEFEKIISPGKNIISSEGLTGNPFYKNWNSKFIADRLHQLFPEARILIKIRNQYNLVRSLYGHFIREGGSLSFQEFVKFREEQFIPIDQRNSIWDHTINMDTFKYSNLINYYAIKFGESNITVLPMEYIFSKQNAYLAKVSQFLGFEFDLGEISTKKVHPGYAKNQIYFARFLNRMFVSHHNRYPLLGIFKKEFQSHGFFHYHRFSRKLLSLKILSKLLGNKKLHDPILEQKMKEYFTDSNKQLEFYHDLNLSFDNGSYY